MINSKKAFVAIGMSVVLSSYLVAGPPPCSLVDGKFQVKNNSKNWIEDSFNSCVYKASHSSADAVVSFISDMSIVLDNNITITGNHHVTIDGEGQNIVIDGNNVTNLLIDTNTNRITLKDLTLQNGVVPGGGSLGTALQINSNSGDVNIANVTFSDNNNSGSGGRGGAVYIADTNNNITVNVTDSTFLRNSAVYGGAIYSGSEVSLNIDNTEFIQNDDLTGEYHGCAGVYASSNGDVVVKNSLFHANKTVNQHGHNGVVLYTGESTTLDINNTIFSSHSAVYQGSSATALIKMDNSGSLTINESEFYDNNISAIYASLYTESDEINATINKTIFRDSNIIEGVEVGITAKNVTINNSEFINNIGQSIFSANGGSLVVQNSKFSENTAEVCAAISSRAEHVTISNTTISQNEALGGSAICATYSPDFKILSSTISGNLTVYDANDYYAGYFSGVILTVGANLTIESSTIVNNSAESGATTAGIYNIQDPSTVNLNNTILTNNMIDAQQNNTDIQLSSISYSIVGSDVGIAATESNVLRGVDPKLGPLEDNGGTTKTHALLSGSPAINTGYSVIPLDQRGEQRDNSPDIGSYEYQGGGVNPSIIMYLLN